MNWFTATVAAVLVASGSVAAKTATIELNTDELQFNQSRELLTYPTFDTISFGSHARIPAEVFYIELLGTETKADITVSVDRTLLPFTLSASNAEIATAADNQYHDRVRSSAQEEGIGANAVVVLDEIEQSRTRFAKILITPTTIDSLGQVSFATAITIHVGSRFISNQELLSSTGYTARLAKDDNQSLASASAPKFLIVTTAALAEPMSKLAVYRTSTGIPTEVNFIDYILPASSGRDDAEKLRNFLKDFYAQGGKYVLLAGDETQLPVRYTYHLDATTAPELIDQIPSDFYFADLTGEWDQDNDGIWGERTEDKTDLTPELFVGRLPIATAQEAEAYVDNLITYETNPGAGDASYLTKAFFFSSDEMRDYAGQGEHNVVAQAYPPYFTLDTVHGVESTSGGDPAPINESGRDVLANLDEGFGIVNIIAHGRMDGFAVRTAGYNSYPKSMLASAAAGDHGDLSDLTKDNKVGFYYSLACDVGGYEEDQPPMNQPGRNFVQEALTIPNAGAVGMIAYSRWGWVGSSYLLQKAFFDSLFTHPNRPAIQSMYEADTRFSYYRDLVYSQTFFGDPTMKVYIDVPQTMAVSLQYDQYSLRARVTTNGDPLAECKIVVSENWNILGTYITDDNGWVTLDAPLSTGTGYAVTAVKTGFTVAQTVFTAQAPTGVGNPDKPPVPENFSLNQNYPNPFNPTTTIGFALPKRSAVTLAVYNMLGQEVALLEDDTKPAGEYAIVWDGTNKTNGPVASGVYFYRLITDEFTDVRSMVLIR